MKTKKVRPVLVKSESKSFKGDLVIDTTQKLGIHIANTEPSYHNKQQLILISLEDEKIEVEDVFLADNRNNIKDSPIYSIQKCKKIINEWIFGDDLGLGYNPDWSKKVIASQSQLSPELIQQLVDEYNNGGMKDFEIKMENWQNDNGIIGCGRNDKFQPKLTNGFVTVVKEPILYTEEEVENILTKYSESLQSVLNKYLIELTPVRWFRENKKNKTTTD